MKEKNKIRLDELDFIGIAKDLIQNMWMILMAAAACTILLTSFMKLTHEEQFSSSVTFAVMAKGTNGNAYASLSTTTAMADVFGKVFQSDIMRRKVADELEIASFDGKITTNIVNETNLLQLTVTTKDPKEAYFGVQAIMNNYTDVADYLFGNAVLEVLKAPQISMAPSNPLNLYDTQKMVFLGGSGLMMLLIVFFSITRNTVKNKKNAMRRLDGKYLGTAPHEMKNRTIKSMIHKYNKAVLVSNPICGFRFAQALQKLTIRIEYHLKKKKKNMLMVTSYAENEGKTTMTANIAINLAAKGYRVLVMELDLKRSAIYKVFEQKIGKESGVLQAMDDIENLEKYIVYDEKEKLYLLMNHSYVKESQDILTSEKMIRLLEKLREVMDYVIIDTPPMQVSSDAEIISSLVDASVLVVRQDWVDVRDINDGIDLLKQGKSDFIGYILNNAYEKRGKEHDFGYSYSSKSELDYERS
ncbi:MAG: polysaccharide biosynthesis tyrosine autokinase [Lachnospiraceae bacterium]|nr:polysaccharide biosynthesis tyrosine autokinase [Lachnospiraceae bacterium]